MLSVIIPTLNDERRLVQTLACLVPGAADGLIAEAIVADGGSGDGTATVADIAGCRLVAGPADRGLRLAAAARIAKAPWLMFLPPGVVLDQGWIGDVHGFLAAVSRRGEAGRRAAVFRPGTDGFGWRPRLAVLGMRTGLALGLGAAASQGLLILAAHYHDRGGHPPGARAEERFTRRLGRHRLTLLRSHAILLGS